jgi:hypothetical protein
VVENFTGFSRPAINPVISLEKIAGLNDQAGLENVHRRGGGSRHPFSP